MNGERTSDASALRAAERVVAIQARYARAGVSMARAAMAGATRYEPLRHYPRHDVVDREARCQFYYHGHDSHRMPADEHGHFHLFVRDGGPGGFFHLAGLSLDAQGWPLRWFATNRWVTGERWTDAATAIAWLPAFRPRAAGRMAPVADWLGAMVALHAGDLAAMLRRRDALVARRLAALRTSGADPDDFFEDRRQHVLVQTRVSLPRRLAQVAGIDRPPIHDPLPETRP